MSRQSPSLSEPPADCAGLAGGEEFDPTGREFSRCFWEGTDTPWHFGNDGGGRFDLTAHPGEGTCYLASDDVGAMREVVGPTYRAGSIVSTALFAERCLWRITSDSGGWTGRPVADLRDDSWDGIGVSQELFTLIDYELSQKWANCLRTAGYDGIRGIMRHLLARQRFGFSVFGPEGLLDRDPRFPHTAKKPIDDASLDEFRRETKIRVESTAVGSSGLNIVS